MNRSSLHTGWKIALILLAVAVLVGVQTFASSVLGGANDAILLAVAAAFFLIAAVLLIFRSGQNTRSMAAMGWLPYPPMLAALAFCIFGVVVNNRGLLLAGALAALVSLVLVLLRKTSTRSKV